MSDQVDGVAASGAQQAEQSTDESIAPLKDLNESSNSMSSNSNRDSSTQQGGHLNMDSLMDVPVTLSVEIGRKRMPINELVSLSAGTIVDLNRDLDAPLDLLVNGTLIARGEVVVMGKKFGLRLVDICSNKTPITELAS